MQGDIAAGPGALDLAGPQAHRTKASESRTKEQPVDLSQWLVDELDDITTRLHTQVLELVPPSRRRERPGGGSPILWNSFHAARHASLALAVLSDESWSERAAWLEDLVPKADPGIGVEEAAPPWADEFSPEKVDGYLDEVLAGVRRFLAGPGVDLDAVPDVSGALSRAGIGPGEFGWLHRMWQDKPAAWLVRWPLLGHVSSHVGEMIATRNRMGLSPF
jgi:hypothetical protein